MFTSSDQSAPHPALSDLNSITPNGTNHKETIVFGNRFSRQRLWVVILDKSLVYINEKSRQFYVTYNSNENENVQKMDNFNISVPSETTHFSMTGRVNGMPCI